MREFLGITRALADASRVRAVLALQRGELCVCQISELLGLAPSTISRHLSILHQAGLIVSRRSKRWVYYRLPANDAPPVVRDAIRWAGRRLAGASEVRQDRRKLGRILKIDPVLLCRRQARR